MLINLDLGRLQALKISSNRVRDLQQISGISGISEKSQGAKMRFQDLRFSAKKIGADGRIGSSAPDQIKKSMQMELFPQPNDDFECAWPDHPPRQWVPALRDAASQNAHK